MKVLVVTKRKLLFDIDHVGAGFKNTSSDRDDRADRFHEESGVTDIDTIVTIFDFFGDVINAVMLAINTGELAVEVIQNEAT